MAASASDSAIKPGKKREKDCDDDKPRPNPCRPSDEGHKDCNCCHEPGSYRPKKPRRPRRGRDDCARQVYEMLCGIKGMDLPKARKPKEKPAVKLQRLCETVGISDAILPALAVLWERHRNGDEPRTDFERTMADVFNRYDEGHRKAMDMAFEAYRKLRKGGRSECMFNDCLADAGEREGIEGSWMASEFLREGLEFGAQTLFSGSGGVMGPGQTRLWDKAHNRGPNGSGTTIFVGPWPWLTAVLPDMNSVQEYGNVTSFRPQPGQQHIWQPYQYATECTYTAGANGAIQSQCQRKHPVVPSGGIGGWCEGGSDYTKGNDCIAIPAVRAGQTIRLRGFNFITETVKVRFQSQSNPALTQDVDCLVWGDGETAPKDDTDHSIVDERVRDWVAFELPKGDPTVSGAALPAGLYTVSVIVDNVTNVIWDSHVPATLQSNSLVLRVEPDVNVTYRIWSDAGRCIDETPGWGDDEIWWDAFVGHIVPPSIPVSPGEPSPPADMNLDRIAFPRDQWKDMDSGEAAGAFSIDLFGPKSFELYGVVIIGMLGLEVDSEGAARDQIKSFGEAYWEALKAVATVATGAEGTLAALADIASIGLTATLIVVAVVAALVLIGLCFWAAWAPADLVALDIITFDALSAWNATDPAKPVPGVERFKLGDKEEDGEVNVIHRPLPPKRFTPGDAAATYVFEHQYDTPSGEDASYVLQFKIARTG
jgi:hypothetical protein